MNGLHCPPFNALRHHPTLSQHNQVVFDGPPYLFDREALTRPSLGDCEERLLGIELATIRFDGHFADLFQDKVGKSASPCRE